MNVYFINPTYVKPEGWKPLLTYLKVKAVYSFIPVEEMDASLYSIIKPFLKASYSQQNMKKFSDSCAFWLRAHFEKYIHLLTEDYEDVNSVPLEELKKYSSSSAFNNIKFLNEDNCLILLKLESSFDEEGTITAPHFFVSDLVDSNLPTHITRFCINILHKKYGHNQYQKQSAFVVFDEFFTQAFIFNPRKKEWNSYYLHCANGSLSNFMNAVNRGIRDLSPNEFPLIEVNDKKHFTRLRTDEGDEILQKLIKDAEETATIFEKDNQWTCDDSGDDIDALNRAFWRECGEGGSNCESWPGWD